MKKLNFENRDELLEEMEILPDKTKIQPNRYWSNLLGCHIQIKEEDSLMDILEEIYDIAYKHGLAEGKTTRSREIKQLILGEYE
jgi:hypothetical protein